jgi:type II secretory pathway component GspD/PulD (secretin)
MTMRFAKVIFAAAVVLSGSGLWAQTAPEVTPAKTTSDTAFTRPKVDVNTLPVQTFYLKNVSTPNDGNEILTAIRNLLSPDIKIYFVPGQNAIFIRASAEQLALAQRLIAELDRPKKLFRLNYTVIETDGGKQVSSQRFVLMAQDGQRVTLKQGSKVPLVTGNLSGQAGASPSNQVQYLDIGMNFDSTLVSTSSGGVLKAKVEQSSVAEEKSGVGPQDPVIRQTSMEGTSVLTMGKPLMLFSVDVPGSARHVDVEVMMELVP